MPDDALDKAENNFAWNPIVYDVSCADQTFVLKGKADTSKFETAYAELILKKRETGVYYTVPFEWLDHEEWKAALPVYHQEITKGIWDFYFRLEANNVRVQLTDDFDADVKVLDKQNDVSRRIWVHQTKKNFLSLKSSPAFIQMDDITFSKDTVNGWMVHLQAVTSDPLLASVKNDDHASMVVKHRNTYREIVFPAMVGNNELFVDCDYREILDFHKLEQQNWDCYLLLHENGDRHLARIAWEGTNQMKGRSGVQVEAEQMYNLYFATTIYNKLSIRMEEWALTSNVESISLEGQTLQMKGFACLDAVHPETNNQIERQLIIKRRGSQESIPFVLTKSYASDGQPNPFAIAIPLKQVLALGCDGIEVYDLSVQVQYKGNSYEEKLGMESFTYVKDYFLTDTTVRHKGFVRFYITYTPTGKLKLEAYLLSTAAFFYFKYGRKLDLKLHKNKEIWLIGERFNTAQDTGYHFFKYCREQYPDFPVYYVINRHAKDVKNLTSLGNVLYSGSLKHTRISSIATTFIGSHELDNILPVKGSDLSNYVQGNRVFLQHGVLGRKNVEYHKYYYQYPFHLFCVSSQAEKELVQKEMSYSPDEVKVTGLSRFDQLLQSQKTKDTILFIPTWRGWLNTEEKLTASRYFQSYQSLLNNKELHQLLEANDLKLKFYPHYRMQPFVSEFKKFATDRLEIVELGDRNVQDLLVESKLMLTDYSSVSFDFNYMSKPVIFYHFDVNRFFKNGILRPVEETFLGDICSTENQVIQAIRYYIQTGFVEKATVKEKKQQVFSHIDQKNNERIFQEINRLS